MTNPKKLTPEEEAKINVERVRYSWAEGRELVHELALEMELNRWFDRRVQQLERELRWSDMAHSELKRQVVGAADDHSYFGHNTPTQTALDAALDRLRKAHESLPIVEAKLAETTRLGHQTEGRLLEQLRDERARMKVLRAMVAGALGLEVPRK